MSEAVNNGLTVKDWFTKQGFQPAAFQRELWKTYASGHSGLLIAPTGAGKTYAMMGAIIAQAQKQKLAGGSLRVLWITPLRALAGDIAAAITAICTDTLPDWRVELRTGDSSSSVKLRQRKKLPEVLVTTPESLHVMLSYANSSQLFNTVACVVVDEWHSLLDSKRGVMMQLALAHLGQLAPDMYTWGMSATIGNPETALQTLLAAQARPQQVVVDTRPKKLVVHTIIPAEIERFPWAGHMGDALLPQILQIIQASKSTLLFTNTRNQAETWYRKLLAADKDLSGQLALHHGSLSQSQRLWVEAALHDGRLKAVVATSSLDLGVDFRPVDTVIQIGGPKGVARFLQRAGRSGHAPGETSKIYFAPTNTLELFEAAALQKAVKDQAVESVYPPHDSLDVLTQWLVTLGTGDGFQAGSLYQEIKKTEAYKSLNQTQWQWALDFVTRGGSALQHYEHYQKLSQNKQGIYVARSHDIERRHRLAIGAITSTTTIPIQVLRGSILGSIEESFAAGLTAGQTFWFAGRALSFVRIRDNKVWVRASTIKRGITPAWSGGRLPLSSQLAALLRGEVAKAAEGILDSTELKTLQPLIKLQATWSRLPEAQQILVEQFQTRAGHHICIYPFEGRATHEMLALLMGQRLGVEPNTFSFAFNDYGFEVLAAKPLQLTTPDLKKLFSLKQLTADVAAAIENGSLPRRQFRSIAVIAGLINGGRPGKPQSSRHLQASSETIYDVLRTYDPDNQLLQQAYDEVLDTIIDIDRLKITLQRLHTSDFLLTYPPHPTPFAFPLMTERLRERLSTEKLADRLQRMQAQLERYAQDL